MMRVLLLVVTVLFLLVLAVLTIYDVASNGVTPLDIVSLLLIAFFGVAIVGALSTRPPEDGPNQL